MDEGILESKRKRSGRGVKEKEAGFDGCSGSKSGNATYMKSDQNKGDAIASVVTDEPVVKEKQDTSVDTGSLNVENTSLKSYPPLPMQGSTLAGNTLVVPVKSIKAVSERCANTAYGFFLGKRVAYPVFANYDRSSYVRAMIELKADVELRDNIEECPKNPGLGVAKNMKKPSQDPKGFPVGSKVGFNPAKEYRPVPKKPTKNTSGNKKHDVKPTKQVSNSNIFDVLNSVENDVDLGTNGKGFKFG
nr:hypothetical protein [Tanacetum cinerariifolium]